MTGWLFQNYSPVRFHSNHISLRSTIYASSTTPDSPLISLQNVSPVPLYVVNRRRPMRRMRPIFSMGRQEQGVVTRDEEELASIRRLSINFTGERTSSRSFFSGSMPPLQTSTALPSYAGCFAVDQPPMRVALGIPCCTFTPICFWQLGP